MPKNETATTGQDGAAPARAAERPAVDVRALRTELGGERPLSRVAFAKLAGVHKNTVKLWEGGMTPNAKRVALLRDLASKAAARKDLAPPKAGRSAARGAARKGAAPARPTTGAASVAAIRASLGLSRAALAKRLGASAESVRLWESGRNVPNPRFAAKLRALSRRPAKGAAAKRAGRETAARGAPRATVDVRALRVAIGKRMGLEIAPRSVLAKLVGAVVNSVANWETGTEPSAEYVTRLRGIAAKAARGELALPAGKAAPKKVPARVRRAIAGDVPIVYADHAAVTRSPAGARLRFAITVPGEKAARLVADLVVPADVLARLGH